MTCSDSSRPGNSVSSGTPSLQDDNSFPVGASTDAPPESTSHRWPVHILIVDDNDDVLNVERLRLQRLGFKVTTCSMATDALEHFAADPNVIDLILTDEVMSPLSGLELTRTLRRQGHQIPIIVMSGYSSDLTPETAALAGADSVLMKPFGAEDVTTHIYGLLGVTPKR